MSVVNAIARNSMLPLRGIAHARRAATMAAASWRSGSNAQRNAGMAAAWRENGEKALSSEKHRREKNDGMAAASKQSWRLASWRHVAAKSSGMKISAAGAQWHNGA